MPDLIAGRGGAGGVGPTADVYALGAILYEMLTGRPPFCAETILETVRQVQEEEPVAPRRLQPKLPRDLETVCLKCLAKDPRRRYARAADLADDLGRFVQGVPVRARPVGPLGRLRRWGSWNPALACLTVGLIVIGLLGVAGVAWQWRQAETALVRPLPGQALPCARSPPAGACRLWPGHGNETFRRSFVPFARSFRRGPRGRAGAVCLVTSARPRRPRRNE